MNDVHNRLYDITNRTIKNPLMDLNSQFTQDMNQKENNMNYDLSKITQSNDNTNSNLSFRPKI